MLLSADKVDGKEAHCSKGNCLFCLPQQVNLALTSIILHIDSTYFFLNKKLWWPNKITGGL